MRIDAITDATLVNSNYRAYQPIQQLGRAGHEIRISMPGKPPFSLDSLLQADVVLVHRFAGRDIQRVLTQVGAAGVGIVWDNDDDLTAIPKGHMKYGRRSHEMKIRAGSNIEATLRLADVVTTPSSLLVEKFRAGGARDVRHLENFLPTEFRTARPRQHDGIALAWLAGLEHQIDYEKLQLRRVLERLLETHVDLRIISIGLGLGLPSDRYEHVRAVDFFDLVDVLSTADIGIAPLADIPWNQARSNVKLKEYGAAGLAWLASPVGAYVGMGEKQGGRIVVDDQWFEAISNLIVNERARRKLAKRASKWAAGQTIDKHVHLWETALADAAARAQSTTSRP